MNTQPEFFNTNDIEKLRDAAIRDESKFKFLKNGLREPKNTPKPKTKPLESK